MIKYLLVLLIFLTGCGGIKPDRAGEAGEMAQQQRRNLGEVSREGAGVVVTPETSVELVPTQIFTALPTPVFVSQSAAVTEVPPSAIPTAYVAVERAAGYVPPGPDGLVSGRGAKYCVSNYAITQTALDGYPRPPYYLANTLPRGGETSFCNARGFWELAATADTSGAVDRDRLFSPPA